MNWRCRWPTPMSQPTETGDLDDVDDDDHHEEDEYIYITNKKNRIDKYWITQTGSWRNL